MLSFKEFLIACIVIAIFSFIMLAGANDRYTTITRDVIGVADRIECPISTNLNTDQHRVEYTASCPWGEMTGILNAFMYLVDSPTHMNCYDASYQGRTFRGCEAPS